MKTGVYILFFWLAASGPLLTAAQPANGLSGDTIQVTYLSLDECVSLALKHNLDVQRAKTDAAIQGLYHHQAKMQQLPSVSSYIDHGMNSGRSINPSDNSYITQSFTSANYSLSASLSLFNGFKVRSYIRMTDLDHEARELDAQQQKDALTIQVMAAYLEVLNQQEILNNYYKQQLSTQVQYARLDTLNKSGAANPDDYYDMQGQLSSSELAIINQQNVIKTAKIHLFELMNQPMDMDVVLEQPSTMERQEATTQSIDGIYQKALSSLPSVRASVLKYKSATKNVAVEKADYYPSLSLNGGIGTAFSSAASRTIVGAPQRVETGDFVVNGSDELPVYTNTNSVRYGDIAYFDQLKNNYGTSINLTLNIPIFNRLQSRTEVKVARLQQQLAKEAMTSAQTALKNTIGKVYFDQQSALEAYLKQQELVSSYQEYFRISEVKFNAGAITSSDYLIAKNKLDQAENTLVAARYNYIFKTKILSYYQGELSL